jgi:hypothetical protein
VPVTAQPKPVRNLGAGFGRPDLEDFDLRRAAFSFHFGGESRAPSSTMSSSEPVRGQPTYRRPSADERAPTMLDIDQALGPEHRNRLTHCASRRPELVHQGAFARQLLAWAELAPFDSLP